MEFVDLTYEKRGAGAWLTLNRPEQLNSLSKLMLDEAFAALDMAESDPDVKAVVFAAAGRAFCAGADLKFVNDLTPEERDRETNKFVARASQMMDRIEACSKPVIAAVNGVATAGGMELVLCCDIVFAAKSARLGDGHSNFGLLPGAGGSARLPRKVGLNQANYLFFTGELLKAEEFLATGLVNRVVEDSELVPEVEALVTTLSCKSPLGMARMKAMALQSLDVPLAASVDYEQVLSQLHVTSFDRNEGLNAFVDKRKPAFKGR